MCCCLGKPDSRDASRGEKAAFLCEPMSWQRAMGERRSETDTRLQCRSVSRTPKWQASVPAELGKGAVLLQKWGKAAMMHTVQAPADQPRFFEKQPGLTSCRQRWQESLLTPRGCLSQALQGMVVHLQHLEKQPIMVPWCLVPCAPLSLRISGWFEHEPEGRCFLHLRSSNYFASVKP